MARPFNIKDCKVGDDNLVYLSEEDIIEKNLKIFKKETLIFSRIGDIRCGVLTHSKITISPNIIAVILKNREYSPYFLSLFITKILDDKTRGNKKLTRGLSPLPSLASTPACKKLVDLVNIKKSIKPGSDAYSDNGIPFIRISNLSKEGISETDIYIPEKLIENIDNLKPKKDTIFLTKDGSIGIAYKVDKDLDIITSSAILHLSIKKNVELLPDYLTLVLNSIITKLQAQRDSGGSIIQHWRVSEIQQILIPIINIDLQIIISNKIQESFSYRQQSKELLEIGKKGVEMAIESNEEMAIKWIKEELDKVGVKIE